MAEKDADEALMLAYAKGDHDSFVQLYQRHKGGLFRYFKRQCRELSRAEELYQDTWDRVIKGRNSYSPTAKFNTWLYRIAHNLLVDDYRRLAVVKDQIDPLEENEVKDITSTNGFEQIAEQQKQLILKQCMSALPHVQLEAFMLKQESGMDVKSIAAVLNASAEATKSRIRYAMSKLSECVKSKWEGGDE